MEAAARRRRWQLGGGGSALVLVAAGAISYAFVAQGGKAAKPVRTSSTTARPSSTTTTAAVAAPCPPVSGAPSRRTSFSKPPPSCLQPGKSYKANVVTDAGSFTITLDNANPVVVNDFVYLARYKFYNGLIFQRVIPGAVVQGGDPNPLVNTQPQGPGYTVKGAVPKAGAYKVGTVAMVNTGSQPAGTAGSQFFVVVGPRGASLHPLYSLLGQVTSGLDTVKRIEANGTANGNPKVDHYIISMTISSS